VTNTGNPTSSVANTFGSGHYNYYIDNSNNVYQSVDLNLAEVYTITLKYRVKTTSEGSYSIIDGDFSGKSYAYIGVCSNSNPSAPGRDKRELYAWTKVQGVMGIQGPQGPAGPAGPEGPQGDKGDGYTGHPYFIDLEGDMSTINIDIDRTRLYDESNDYCECVLHAYYGNDNWPLPVKDVELDIPKDDNGKDIGKFTLIQDNNDVRIKFVPDEKYVFPTKNLQIPIIVRTKVEDPDNNETYSFERKTIWIIKPIMASFELEIRPSYRVIKIYEDGERFPKNLEVFVYKIEDVTRTLFDLSEDAISCFCCLYAKSIMSFTQSLKCLPLTS
jgi:hypothetical protein